MKNINEYNPMDVTLENHLGACYKSKLDFFKYRLFLDPKKAEITNYGKIIIVRDSKNQIVEVPKLEFYSQEKLSKDDILIMFKGTMGISEIEGDLKNDSSFPIEVLEPGRAVGNTTRLADYYIQKLFNNIGDFIKIEDHHCSLTVDESLVERIKQRLFNEHSGISIEVKGTKIKINDRK